MNEGQRRLCMSRIKSTNTSPEIRVRKILTEFGLRYRLHVKRLPGKPDVIIPKIKTVFFINGCFWHQHKGCKRRSMPRTNIKYWGRKLEGNIQKQKESIKDLRRLGWKTAVIWECQTKNKNKLNKALRRAVEKARV